jgi:hypothetical protein
MATPNPSLHVAAARACGVLRAIHGAKHGRRAARHPRLRAPSPSSQLGALADGPEDRNRARAIAAIAGASAPRDRIDMPASAPMRPDAVVF